MKQELENIHVRFVMFEGDVVAVFMGHDAQRRYTPSAVGKGQFVRMSYQHMGQHGECYDGMYRRKRATREQYEPLLAELESLGYNVIIK